MADTGAVILAGGKSSRMGRDKALLRLGRETFLEKILAQLSRFPEIFISASREGDYTRFGVPVVLDLYPGKGPMGGLYSALVICRSPALLAIGCDKPLFEAALGHWLISRLEGFDAAVPITRDGRVQPLCAVYAKSCKDVFLSQIQKGDYRMTHALKLLRTNYIALSRTAFSDSLLSNINTPEQYETLGYCQA
jgi:molybdopterin-guanine dinucleotide biosynthesis protein A